MYRRDHSTWETWSYGHPSSLARPSWRPIVSLAGRRRLAISPIALSIYRPTGRPPAGSGQPLVQGGRGQAPRLQPPTARGATSHPRRADAAAPPASPEFERPPNVHACVSTKLPTLPACTTLSTAVPHPHARTVHGARPVPSLRGQRATAVQLYRSAAGRGYYQGAKILMFCG